MVYSLSRSLGTKKLPLETKLPGYAAVRSLVAGSSDIVICPALRVHALNSVLVRFATAGVVRTIAVPTSATAAHSAFVPPQETRILGPLVKNC
jgi:hypothetical protein